MPKKRELKKTSTTRPRKKPREKARRERDQKKRLIELGVSEEETRHMTAREIRTLLKRPSRAVAAVAAES